jgi:hypothetical protein
MSEPTIAERAVLEWGTAFRYTMRRENRARMTSPLFDVQRRQIIGYESHYAVVPRLVSEFVAAGLTPQETARRMRSLMQRPYLLQIFELMINPLLAREQRLLGGGQQAIVEVAAYDAEQLPIISEFVSELVRAYRDDPEFGPSAGNDERQLVLDEQDIELCRAALVSRPVGDVAAIARSAGAIGLYSVLLHGEHRDGIFDHGPYPGPGDTRLLVREINDLCNDYLPWSSQALRLSVSGIAIVYAYRDAELSFDLFGGVATEPADLTSQVESVAILARTAAGVAVLSPEALTELSAQARIASRTLFADVAAWEPAARILYGADLYANHLRPFTEMLDAHTGGTRGAQLLGEAHRLGEEIGQRLIDEPMPEVSGYQNRAIYETKPFFTPPTVVLAEEQG